MHHHHHTTNWFHPPAHFIHPSHASINHNTCFPSINLFHACRIHPWFQQTSQVSHHISPSRKSVKTFSFLESYSNQWFVLPTGAVVFLKLWQQDGAHHFHGIWWSRTETRRSNMKQHWGLIFLARLSLCIWWQICRGPMRLQLGFTSSLWRSNNI